TNRFRKITEIRNDQLLVYTLALKLYNLALCSCNFYFNRVTAHFTIFYVGLTVYRSVYQHRNGFKTIGTQKKMLSHGKEYLVFSMLISAGNILKTESKC